jgi:hypothetical protein
MNGNVNGLYGGIDSGNAIGLYNGINGGIGSGVVSDISTYVNYSISNAVLNVDASNINSYPRFGTNWFDLSGGNINGTLTNSPTYNTTNGGSFNFNGSNTCVEFGDVLDLGTNDLTINQWIYLNSYGFYYTLSKALAGNQNFRYAVSTGFISLGVNNRLGAFMQGNGGSDVGPYGSTILPLNTWFLATFVYTRSSSIRIFYNGREEVLNGSSTISQWNGLNFQSSNPFRIGSYTSADNTGISFVLNGRIASTQVYFRSLNQSEILQYFLATKSKFNL